MIGVLILVDQHIAELPLIMLAGFPIRLQQTHRVQNNIVKIQCVGIPQSFCVKRIHFTNANFTPIPHIFPIGCKRFGRLHGILCRGDNGENFTGRE